MNSPTAAKINIVIISGNESTAKHVIKALDRDIHIKKVIIDPGEKRSKILRKRIKRIGLFSFLGQLLFRFLMVPILHRTSKHRKAELIKSYTTNRTLEILPPFKNVANINSVEGNQTLKSLKPEAVVVVTRRIISKRTLNRIGVPFINIHDGIVPKYRGLFGAYWAMKNRDLENCGATVHLIDENLDTGPIIAQTNITDSLTDDDNFVTYPIHQFASALPLLNRALLDLSERKLTTHTNQMEVGEVRFIPTIWSYLHNRWMNGLK